MVGKGDNEKKPVGNGLIFENNGYVSNDDTLNSRPKHMGRFKAQKVLLSPPHDHRGRRGSHSSYNDSNAPDNDSSDENGTTINSVSDLRAQNLNFINSEEVMLLHSELKKVQVKDFTKEVRATMDIEDFFKDGDVFIDVHANTLEEVLEHILDKIRHKEKDIGMFDAKNSILTFPLDVFTNSLQGTCVYDGWVDLDQSWICGLCTMTSISTRRICIAKLKHAMNMGPTTQEVRFVILILTPANSKKTKSELEVGRTISTLFCDVNFRSEMMNAKSDGDVFKAIKQRVEVLKDTRTRARLPKVSSGAEVTFDEEKLHIHKTPEDENSTALQSYGRRIAKMDWLFLGVRQDILRRGRYYLRDYVDGVTGVRALSKLISTTLFLYFAILLPLLALGVTNKSNTDGAMTIKKMIVAQGIGGAIFSFFGGQHLVILITTAPVVIFTLIIKEISEDLGDDFFTLYCVSGLFNSFFLAIYSCTNCCYLMKFCYRSVDEVFGVFISIAFVIDAIKSCKHIHDDYYRSCPIINATSATLANATTESAIVESAADGCGKEIFLLALLLMLGTLWLGVTLFNFTKSPYLDSTKRVLLADYALPGAVLIFSFIGSYCAKDINSPTIESDDESEKYFEIPDIAGLSIGGWLVAVAMGFCLSILFFIDQNISASFVNNPKNNLKKGPAYHLDLLVLAVINAVLSIFALPWIHGALPHSPLHVRALAEFEERMQQGVMTDVVVKVHETRLTSILANALIGVSIYMFPTPIEYIPVPVLDGVLLYVAAVSLLGNEFFERLLLWVTEQSAYPPNHYVRHVTQKKIHLFTFLQVLQLLILCGLGFAPLSYLKMVFPVALGAYMPIRHFLFPKMFEQQYLDALDGH
ncbi:LOW QUALITY PROTEIN: solute carrier family 4 member 11-like [Symsagittifera roscoffensis]|uniref:LOW QUALITY PROTEIN: solute carrier family 4 member 11-like n=1 Tax=Symsagittifera roscoffensis TaxID=84072 RepID=UPI00307C4801